MNRFFYCSLWLVCISLLECKPDNGEISQSELKELKSRYSKEVINHLYETVFYLDYVGKKDSLSKWKTDLIISLEGDIWKNDSLYVAETIHDINELHLPIKLQLTKNPAAANLNIYFGTFDYLKKKLGRDKLASFRGVGIITPRSEITYGKIGIANNATSYNVLSGPEKDFLRKKTITEELNQSLGITGDSWKHYGSIFFEGRSRVSSLQNIDKEVIRLLYESSLSTKLSREKFEIYFKDVLYGFDAKNKLLRFVTDHRVPIAHLEFIRDHCLKDSIILKYPKNVFLKIDGDVQRADTIFWKEAIVLLNSVGENLAFTLVKHSSWNETPSIAITYNDSSRTTYPVTTARQGFGEAMYKKRVQGLIKINYGMPGVNRYYINKLLVKSICALSGLENLTDDVVERDSGGKLKFRKNYKDILALLYNPVIRDGVTKKEMSEVIDMVKRKVEN